MDGLKNTDTKILILSCRTITVSYTHLDVYKRQMCGQPIGQAIYGVLFDIFAAHTWVVLIGAAIAALLISLYSKKIFGRLENSK